MPYPVPPQPAGLVPGQALPPPDKRPTNGFAIASLVFGLLGGVLLGVIFGCVALSQIKRDGRRGRGMAVAGLVLSGMWIALAGVGVLVGVLSGPTTPRGPIPAGPPAAGGPSTAGWISLDSLTAGDCVNGVHAVPDGGTVKGFPSVPCTQPHEAEVVGAFSLPAGPYPDQNTLQDRAGSECTTLLNAYSPSAAVNGSIQVTYTYPLAESWPTDREVTCLATASSGTATGSLKAG